MKTDPLPSCVVRVPPPVGCNGVSSLKAEIKQPDGTPLPLAITKARISIDWENGDPVVLDLEAKGGFGVDATAGLRSIEINGKRYRLIEAGLEPESDPYRQLLQLVIDEERKTACLAGGPREDGRHERLDAILAKMKRIDDDLRS